MVKWLSLTFLALLCRAGIVWWQWSPAIPSLEEGPSQGICLRLPIAVKGHSVQPLMTYRLTGRVVSTHPYHDSGCMSVSPVDLGLVWGKSADPRRLAKDTFTQGDRFMHWRWPSPESAIASTDIANTHIIPATPEIEARVLSIHTGDTIRLRGYLVRVDGVWTSSLTRRDTGDGACEVMYVTEAAMVPVPGASPPPAAPGTGFKRFFTTLTENSGGRRIAVVVVAKQGAKIAFFRRDNQRLYVLTLDRLSRDDRERLAALGDGAEAILRKIEQGLYAHQSDLPDGS